MESATDEMTKKVEIEESRAGQAGEGARLGGKSNLASCVMQQHVHSRSSSVVLHCQPQMLEPIAQSFNRLGGHPLN